MASEAPVNIVKFPSVSAPTPTEQPLTGALSNAPIWVQEGPPQNQVWPSLLTKHTDVSATPYDVVVCGGGIVGVSTAFLLKKSGKKVALIEGRRIGCGTTGSSTCKLSADQQGVYTKLVSKYNEETARLYGEMNMTAITQVEELVKALNIDCDFKRKYHATWTAEESKVKDIEHEYDCARKAGLPVQLLRAEQLELPESIGIKRAVLFENQGEFNAYKFVTQLARHVDGDGCKVYEGSMVSGVSEEKDKPHTITCETGGSLQATYVVLATHLPILDRSSHFMLLPPSKSHVVAVKLAKGDGTRKNVGAGQMFNMYINLDSEKRSTRTTQDGSVLIVSGESFETGDETDVEHRYASLEQWAAKHFKVEQNLTRWSAMDYFSSAVLPYVGLLYRGTDTIFTATGFSKWGLANGVASGMIIRDLIQGIKNPWSEMVDARRWDLIHQSGGLAQEGWHTAKHFISDKIKALVAPDIKTLAAGEGGLYKIGHETVGAYKDKNGAYHLVKPVCTHLGCHVVFNKTDRCWDCPCHGSQYDIDGRVIHGPACKDLCKRDDLKW